MREIPETCEVVGEVGKPSHNPKRCTNAVKVAVSVESLLPLYVCNYHALHMKKFWGVMYDVEVSTVERSDTGSGSDL